MLPTGPSVPTSWWDQHAWVAPPFSCPYQHCIPFVLSPLHVLSKTDFSYASSDPSRNREFMELAWPWGELHYHIAPFNWMWHPDEKDETGDKQGCSVSLRSWLGTLRNENEGALPHHRARPWAPPSPWLKWAGIQRANALLKGSHASSVTSVFEKPVHAAIARKKKKKAKSNPEWIILPP